VQVSAVHLRLGALSGLVNAALMFSFEIACQDTPLQGSRFVEDVAVMVFCSPCQREGVARGGVCKAFAKS
jgi:hydrogenase nickel incorporation protein HypA/HybF